MTGLFEGISNFFTRHRAHCADHEVYQRDCAACVAAYRRSRYIRPYSDPYVEPDSYTLIQTAGFLPVDISDNVGGDSAATGNDCLLVDSSSGLDTSSVAGSSSGVDSSSGMDTSPGMDSCVADTSDFSGFGGGDSAGGGASGDF